MNNDKSIKFLSNTLGKFRRVSFLIINLDKTNVMSTGLARHSMLPLKNIKVVPSPTVLGVIIIIIIIVHEIYLAPLSILIKCSRRFNLLGNTSHHDKESCTFTSERKCKNEIINAKLNKRDLRLLLKDVEESELFSSCRSEFHRAGPA